MGLKTAGDFTCRFSVNKITGIPRSLWGTGGASRHFYVRWETVAEAGESPKMLIGGEECNFNNWTFDVSVHDSSSSSSGTPSDPVEPVTLSLFSLQELKESLAGTVDLNLLRFRGQSKAYRMKVGSLALHLKIQDSGTKGGESPLLQARDSGRPSPSPRPKSSPRSSPSPRPAAAQGVPRLEVELLSPALAPKATPNSPTLSPATSPEILGVRNYEAVSPMKLGQARYLDEEGLPEDDEEEPYEDIPYEQSLSGTSSPRPYPQDVVSRSRSMKDEGVGEEEPPELGYGMRPMQEYSPHMLAQMGVEALRQVLEAEVAEYARCQSELSGLRVQEALLCSRNCDAFVGLGAKALQEEIAEIEMNLRIDVSYWDSELERLQVAGRRLRAQLAFLREQQAAAQEKLREFTIEMDVDVGCYYEAIAHKEKELAADSRCAVQ